LGLVSNAFRRNAAHTFGKHATPASFFTISGRGYSKPARRPGTTCQALKKLAAPLPHFDAPPCSRSLGIRHEFTIGLASQLQSICELVSQPLEMLPFRDGTILKSDRNLSRSFSRRSHAEAALLELRRASCRGILSLRKDAPFSTSAPTYQPFDWRLSQSCL